MIFYLIFLRNSIKFLKKIFVWSPLGMTDNNYRVNQLDLQDSDQWARWEMVWSAIPKKGKWSRMKDICSAPCACWARLFTNDKSESWLHSRLDSQPELPLLVSTAIILRKVVISYCKSIETTFENQIVLVHLYLK